MTREEILSSKDFHDAPLGVRLELLRAMDPSFAKLDPKEQGRIINEANPKTKQLAEYIKSNEGKAAYPEDKGFVNTLGEMASGLWSSVTNPNNFKIRSPKEAMADMIISHAPQILHAGQAQKAAKAGDIPDAIAHGLSAITPGGPEAYQIGEEIANRQYGQAAAHLTPFVLAEMGARPEVRKAAGAAAKDVGTVGLETGKGAWRGITATEKAPAFYKMATGAESAPIVFKRGAAGGAMAAPLYPLLGPMAPIVGAAAGAALPIAQEAYSGFKKGIRAARTNREVAALRPGNLERTAAMREIAKALTAENRVAPEVKSIAPPEGYVRQAPMPQPEAPIAPRTPAWQNFPQEQRTVPSVEPIYPSEEMRTPSVPVQAEPTATTQTPSPLAKELAKGGIYQDPAQLFGMQFENEGRVMAARRVITEAVTPVLRQMGLTERDLLFAKEQRIDNFIRQNNLGREARYNPTIVNQALRASMKDQFEAIKDQIKRTGVSKQGNRYNPSVDTIDAITYGLEE